MKHSWNNVEAFFSIEVCVDEGTVWADGDELAVLKPFLLGDGELIIVFTSSGFDDPGSMYGGPDNLGSPPDGDDKRLLKTAYIEVDTGRVELPQKIQEQLFDRYEDQILEVELQCQKDTA